MALVVAAASCGDAPLDPPLSPTGPDLSASSGRHLGQTPHPCAVSAARPPATYEIAGPTASRDTWWIAERGTVKVNCNGYYSPSAFGYKLWIGVASYAGESDLHMVMEPGHPDF